MPDVTEVSVVVRPAMSEELILANAAPATDRYMLYPRTVPLPPTGDGAVHVRVTLWGVPVGGV